MSDTDSTHDPNEVADNSRDLFDFDSDETYDPLEETEVSSNKKKNENQDISKTENTVKLSGKSKMKTSKMMKTISRTHEISDSDSDTVDLELSRSSSQIHTISSDTDSECEILNKNVNNKKIATGEISPMKNKAPTVSRKSASKEAGTSNKGKLDFQKSDTLPVINSPKKNKPVCQYGSKCYRKNPSHFKEFLHPEELDLKRKHSSDAEHESSFKKTKYTTESPAGTSHSHLSSSAAFADSTYISSKPLSERELLENSKPYNFFLTKASGIRPIHNNAGAVSLKDILHPSMGTLVKSAQFNYMFEIPWIVEQYPAQFRSCPLLLVHGFTRGDKAALDMDASVYDHIKLCQARLDIMYGTHHSKMMLLLYDKGMRVVISTANLIQRDWYQKTQGLWISPVFPKQSSTTGGDSATLFKQDLLKYLNAYRAKQLTEWIDLVKQHDMSAANVHLIGSVPGRHTSDLKHAFGHLKLRKVLEKHGPEPQKMKNWPVVGQFSSIGSLGPTEDNWMCGEFYTSLSSAKGGGTSLGGNVNKLKLIYPSADNVRTSLEGYPAGGSLPYSINTAKKQTYLHKFLHQWRSEIRGRSRASPHIKSYCRVSPEYDQMSWFLITSANLSKAAWGALEKKGAQLMIRSYEIGVLFLPHNFDNKCDTFNVLNKGKKSTGSLPPFPQPYDLPVVPYTKSDQPWIVDVAYTALPDSHGNMWCPN